MAELTIKVELDQKDRAMIFSLLSSFVTVAKRLEDLTATATEPVAEAEAHPVENPFPAATEAKTEPEVKAYTADEVRSKVMAISRKQPELKAQVKEMLNKYAPNISGLTEEQRSLFMAELEDLANG